MKTYSVFNAGSNLLLEDINLISGTSPKSAIENFIHKKVKRTTNNYEIDFIIEEVKPLENGSFLRMAGKPRLCYAIL